MAAGVSDHLWSWEDIATMIDTAHVKSVKRGPYKKAAAEISN